MKSIVIVLRQTAARNRTRLVLVGLHKEGKEGGRQAGRRTNAVITRGQRLAVADLMTIIT